MSDRTEYIVSGNVSLCTREKGTSLVRGDVFKIGDKGVNAADVKEWKNTGFVKFYAGQALEDSIEKDEQIVSMKAKIAQMEALEAENERLKAAADSEDPKEDEPEVPSNKEVPNGILIFDPAELESMTLDDLNLMIASVCAEHEVEPKEYKRSDYAIKFLSRDFAKSEA